MADPTQGKATPQGEIIESQLDWLTCSFDEGAKSDRVQAWAYSRAQHEKRAGARELPFRLMGFEGWTVGRVRLGLRDGTALLQLSGDLAERYASELVTVADRISRVDLAVTVRLPRRYDYLGEDAYAQASNYRASHPKAALPWIVQDDDNGCTMYVGRRASDRFLRLYNKAAEQIAQGDKEGVQHYERCWRYELEIKGRTARPAALAAVQTEDRPMHCQQQLHRFCTQHGIEPAYGVDQQAVLVPGFRRRSDYESRLAWLKKSVNPAVMQMMEEGDREDILEALGLGLPSKAPN
jgi:DNA relaxase NicK